MKKKHCYAIIIVLFSLSSSLVLAKPKSIVVRTPAELVAALGSNRIIELEPGDSVKIKKNAAKHVKNH